MNKLSPKDIVSSGLCIGCGSCALGAAGGPAGMTWDKYGFLKPNRQAGWYRQKTESFARTCPFSPGAANEDETAAELFPDTPNKSSGLGRFRSAYVGHVAEEDYRLQGSSGGMVTWVACELLNRGLIDGVAHVVATERPSEEKAFFKYRISGSEKQVREGAKSRYYPIEMSEILRFISETPGRYAIVGIPCFLKAVNLLKKQNEIFRERICFTLGLFCGHMKSAHFAESFAWQMNVSPESIQKIDYRNKNTSRPANWYNTLLTLNDGSNINRDWWHLADGDWGAGFFMNSACNYCDDVVAETADISFGDAWVEPYSSDGRGTNVVVVRSPVVKQILEEAIRERKLILEEKDDAFVEQTQAAGFRQRREGLSYRLTWYKKGVKPCKRVIPNSQAIAAKRKIIYRMRYFISAWSNRIFALARRLHTPGLYLFFARLATSVYYGYVYHNGSISEMKNRFKQLKQ